MTSPSELFPVLCFVQRVTIRDWMDGGPQRRRYQANDRHFKKHAFLNPPTTTYNKLGTFNPMCQIYFFSRCSAFVIWVIMNGRLRALLLMKTKDFETQN